MLGRIAAALALAGAVVLVALVLTRSDDPYRVRVQTVNAGQIVIGNRVKVGGAIAGTVTDVRLLDSGVAELELTLKDGMGRLPEGTRASIRAQSVVGSANHFVSLVPGPRGNRPIPDNGRISVSSTTAPVDFDALLDSLDAPTRAGLADFIKGGADQYRDRAPEARRALQYLAPALDGTTTVLREIQRDREATTKLLVKGAIAAKATAAKRDELTALISHTATTTGALADESDALGRTLQALPVTFRKANSTFVNLRSTLDDLDPLVAASKPATRNLAPFLRDLGPLTRASVPTVRDLAAAVTAAGPDNDLIELIRRLAPLSRVIGAAVPRAIRGMNASQHYLDALLAYTPDVAAAVALLDQATSYYDANGHYARTQPSLNKLALDPADNTLSLQDDSQRLRGLETGRGARCPGAAAQAAADGSAPRAFPGCDPADVLPGP